MPASGGSLSDTNVPTNKVVDGQSHYLAYITPDEGKSLMDQGGKEVITDSGIPAYPPLGEEGTSPGTRSDYSPGQGHRDTAGGPPSISGGSAAQASTYTGIPEEGKLGEGSTGETKDSLITKVKNKIISPTDAAKIASKLGWVTDNSFMNALGGAVGVIGMLGTEVQSKAINWDLNRRLNRTFKEVEKGTHPGALGYKISDLQDKMERSQLDPSDPRHYGQDDWTRDYGKDLSAPDDGGNSRGLTNIITPYAAHAVGGTTQQTSQAAKWYANLGSGNSNPGAFNLTQQYAAAKAAVSQKLQSTSSVGQIAVADSAFFNFLKDNSLNKGIL